MNIYIWVIVAIVCALVEAATPQLVSIWFCVGALGSVISCFFTDNWIIQIAVFVLVSGIALILSRPLAKKITKFDRTKTNSDRYIGKVGIVTAEINNELGKGMVNVSGSVWTARSVDNTVILKDTNVEVISIEGVKLMVKPVEKEKE